MLHTMYLFAAGVSLTEIWKERKRFFIEMDLSVQLPVQRYLYVVLPLEDYGHHDPAKLLTEAPMPSVEQIGPMKFTWYYSQKAVFASIHGMHHDTLKFALAMGSAGIGPFTPLDMRVCALLCVGVSTVAVVREAKKNQTGDGPRIGRAERRRYLKKVREYLNQLQNLSKSATDLCLGKAYLVEAELMSVSKRPKDQERCPSLYRVAISLSAKTENLLDEAFASEIAANFMLRHHEQYQREQGLSYLEDAVTLYRRWGATAKVRQLEDRLLRATSSQAKAD